MKKKAKNILGISQKEFEKAYEVARKEIKLQLGGTASSHSRLLYFQKTIETLGLRTRILVTLDLEQTYWRTFLTNAKLFSYVREFILELKSDGVLMANITDLTAQIQFRKMVYFGLDEHFDYVVTSEEAGHDKPDPRPFQIALDKLKIDAEEILPYIPFSDSDNLNIGEWVLAVGNPYNLTSTVTAGIVSAKGRDLQGNYSTDSFIQTDAAVNPGNSGGALVNSRGELVGINTAISTKTGSYIGYSFAVPSNIAKKIIDDILEFGKVQEAIIGFLPDLREDDIQGVRIGDFSEGSNAEKAGLLKGDIIVKINDIKISKFSELTGQLSAKRPGDSIKLTIDRDGEIFTKNINLIKRIERYISRTYGIELIDDPKGAKIIRDGLSEDSPSSIKGYIITKINGKEVETATEAIKLLDGLSRNGYRLKVEMIDLDNETSIYFF